MSARLALGFNPVLSLKDAAAVGQRAESLGYDSVWFHESLYQRDAVSYVASVLLSTSRIRCGSGAINTFTRHPVLSATTFATLAELSGGRAIMGLGLGSFPTVPKLGYKIFPVEDTRPLRRLSEYVEIVRRFWAGEELTFKGEFFTADQIKSDFGSPVQVDLFLASLSPMTQTYAARHADGVILSPAMATLETTSRMVANVKKGESVAGGRKVERASYLLTSLDPDEKKAREVVRGFYFFLYQLAEVIRPDVLEPYGVRVEQIEKFRETWRKGLVTDARQLVPDAAIDALALTGTKETAIARLELYRKEGVTLPIVMPIGNVNYAMEGLAPR